MLDRNTPPSFQKSNSFTLIQPKKIGLPNGLTITVVPGGEQEVAKIELIFKAAKWHETQPGISYFTAQLLQKGTLTKNSFQISSELDQHGVHLEITPGYDFTSIILYGLTKNIDRFFELIREIITKPTFPELELQQAKDIYIQGLKINLEKTSYLASRLLRQTLFGKEHPYGCDADVTDVENIQRQSLVSFHEDHFIDFEIICSGKFTEALTKSLTETLGGVPITKRNNRVIEKKEVVKPTPFLEKENTVQSSIRLGKKIISRIHPDYPALLLLNHILGGYFGSRLMKNIREEKGLTYGIYSSIAALKNDSYLSIGADVNKENRQLTIQEIKNELKKLSTHRISKGELITAKNHFIGSLQAEITTPFAHADKIKNIMLFGLPGDYYQALLNKIDLLDETNLIETAQKYFDTESFSVVAAG
jgi:predicted Zn-dependent peptidase